MYLNHREKNRTNCCGVGAVDRFSAIVVPSEFEAYRKFVLLIWSQTFSGLAELPRFVVIKV